MFEFRQIPTRMRLGDTDRAIARACRADGSVQARALFPAPPRRRAGSTSPRLPDFLRRERFLDMTAGVVASSGHLLLASKVTRRDLSRYP